MKNEKMIDGRKFNAGIRGHDGSKAGRPPLPPGRKRKLRTVKATDEEWEKIKAYARLIKENKGRE